LGLVRSYWRAEVEVLAWQPQFEIVHRRIIPAAQARHLVRDPDEVATRISQRALIEAHPDSWQSPMAIRSLNSLRLGPPAGLRTRPDLRRYSEASPGGRPLAHF
jgi:hypothetical protein